MGAAIAEDLLISQSTDTATDTVHQQVDRLFRLIKDKPLPVFRQSLKKLSEFQDKPDLSINKIVDILRADPGYSCQLFTKANVELSKHKHDIATSLDHAILVLGLPQVIAIGNRLPVVSDIDNPRIKLRVYQCLSQAYHAGVQARELMYNSGKTISEAAFITAQLRDLYIASLWIHASGHIDSLLKNVDIAELYSPCGLLHEIGKRMAKHLFLPDAVQQSFATDVHQSRFISSINFACTIARLAETGWYTKKLDETVIQAADQFNKDEAFLYQSIHKNAVIAARECRLYPARHVAFRLIEVMDDQAQKVKLQAITDKQGETTQQPSGKSSSIPNDKLKNKTAQPEFDHQIQSLVSMGEKKRPPQEILSYSFQILGQIFTQVPMAFFLLDKSKSSLRSRYISGFVDKNITIPVERKHLFGLLMQKQQAVHVSEKNRKRLISVLPAHLPVNIQEREFVAMSLFIRQKPVGLFYVEGVSDNSITTMQYQQFVAVCRAAGDALDEVKHHERKETTHTN